MALVRAGRLCADLGLAPGGGAGGAAPPARGARRRQDLRRAGELALTERALLEAALEYVREGDTFIVTSSTGWPGRWRICARSSRPWNAKRWRCRILDIGVDTGTPGRPAVLEHPRVDRAIRARDHAGAPEGGDRRGEGRRPLPGPQDDRARQGARGQEAGRPACAKAEIARRLNIGERSVYRVLQGGDPK